MNREIKTPLHPKRPLPVGTKVNYYGSQRYYHGQYEIVATVDADGLAAVGRSTDDYFLDHTGYELWPLGVLRKFGNRDRALFFVRRSSITEINETINEVELTPEDMPGLWDMCEDDEIVWAVGTDTVPKLKAALRLAEKSLIREAASGV